MTIEETTVRELQGKVLRSVEWLPDHLQLVFDNSRLLTFNPPRLVVGGKTFSWGEDEYRDQFIRIVGKPVLRAFMELGDKLEIVFESNTLIVSLRDEDYRGPEILKYDSDALWWVI